MFSSTQCSWQTFHTHHIRLGAVGSLLQTLWSHPFHWELTLLVVTAVVISLINVSR